MTRFTYLLLITLWIAGCQSQSPTHGTHAPAYKVLVVNSNQAVPRYAIAEKAFISTLVDTPKLTINLQDDNQPIETLLDTLNQNEFEVIYTIGAKALGSIDAITPDAPVVYSSILSWRQFESHDNYYGVASEVSPQAQLTWFKHFFPELKSIAILYSEKNKQMISEASLAATELNIELIALKIQRSGEIGEKLKGLLTKVNGLWIMPDSTVLDSEQTIQQIFSETHQQNKPVFAYSNFYKHLGATLTINADVATTGRQAALITQKFLDGQAIPSGIQFPAGTSITLNMEEVTQHKLKLNYDALNSVDELFNE